MRRNEAVIANDGAMADVIAAPEDDVVADFRLMLNDIVLEDEAVFTYADVVPNESPRTDIGNRRIPLRLGRVVKPSANPVELGVGDGHEAAVNSRVIAVVHVLEGHHGQAEELVLLEKGSLDAEGHHVVRRIVREVF